MLTGMERSDKNSHVAYLRQALALANARRGFCAPNPAVGALVVKNGNVLAQGTHWAAGDPHAERAALATLGGAAQGALVYVTLEPCCHYGKTPPCTQFIIDAGIERVYYALKDPYPAVAGKGAQALKAAGISCEQIELPEINDFYRSYIYWIKHRKPWVTLKIALSLDGKIAGAKGAPLPITGAELQQYTHENRRSSDALLTTINTIIHDDPQLTIRLDGEVVKKPIYVLDSQLQCPLTANVLTTASRLIIFHEHNADKNRKAQLVNQGVRCVAVNKNQRGLLLADIIKIIGEDGIHDLWVEAGGRCFQSFIEQSLAHRALIYIAPKILGPACKPAFDEEIPLLSKANSVAWHAYGQDVMCELDFAIDNAVAR